jgi:[ribosomal protein S5]-alanine N-acetyltransferase
MTMAPKENSQCLKALKGVTLNLNEVEIKTERLTLRPVTSDYAGIIFKEFTPEITRYMVPPSPKEINETLAFINETTALRKKNLELVVVILGKESEEFLGIAGLHARNNPKEPEFGIWLKKGAHGSRFGKEAIHGLYQWAKENLAVDAFIYPVDKANIQSKKIPESLGGVIIKEVMAPTMSGGMLDEVIYRIPVRS